MARLRARNRRGARVTYVNDLSRELLLHGVGGRARRRILTEVEDHLRSDAGSQERFGSAREIANAFNGESLP